jgi:hypothetical protein
LQNNFRQSICEALDPYCETSSNLADDLLGFMQPRLKKFLACDIVSTTQEKKCEIKKSHAECKSTNIKKISPFLQQLLCDGGYKRYNFFPPKPYGFWGHYFMIDGVGTNDRNKKEYYYCTNDNIILLTYKNYKDDRNFCAKHTDKIIKEMLEVCCRDNQEIEIEIKKCTTKYL